MRRRLSCEETFLRLDDYLDRELNEEEMGPVRIHLEDCAVYGSEFRFEADVIDSVRRKVRRIAAPPDSIRRVSERLHHAVEPERNIE
jgi:hypothetical protein